MERVLVVTSQPKSVELFEQLLAPRAFEEIYMAGDAGEAARVLLEREFDLCLINTPLRDEFGLDLAQSLVDGGFTQVLVIVKGELFDQVVEKMEPFGVFVLAKPINRQLLWSSLQLMSAAYNRLKGMYSKNRKLLRKIEDIRLIDRAKCTLIVTLKMTEDQAHKYIEKQAMDMRLTRREVAERILRTYEG